MPSTIDERKITFTETGGATVRHDVVKKAIQTTLATGFSITSSFFATLGSSPAGELARHEFRIVQGGVAKATINWDTESYWSGAAPATWSFTENSHSASPAHSGSVTSTRPGSATHWAAAFTISSNWAFDVFLWKSQAAGFTVSITTTALANGVQFGITLLEGTQTRFAGTLAFTHSST